MGKDLEGWGNLVPAGLWPHQQPHYKDGETEAEDAYGLITHPKREETPSSPCMGPHSQAAQGLLTALLPAECPAPGQHRSPTAGMARARRGG